ncbi:synaptojanin-2-binding protein-like isoform X2 [Heptranchias perlo]|uniref:synaptojanin-2-binding protein-like isoform X2 n=1 Tax=Heptranchias perlo TaxID=212740 RepID=UPI00355A55D1
MTGSHPRFKAKLLGCNKPNSDQFLSSDRPVEQNQSDRPRGFGFNILGGVDKPCYPGNNGIFVAKIRENEAAALDGRLREGDKILEAGGVSLVNIQHEEAAKVFRNATNAELALRIERQVGYEKSPGFEFGDDVCSAAKWKQTQPQQRIQAWSTQSLLIRQSRHPRNQSGEPSSMASCTPSMASISFLR